MKLQKKAFISLWVCLALVILTLVLHLCDRLVLTPRAAEQFALSSGQLLIRMIGDPLLWLSLGAALAHLFSFLRGRPLRPLAAVLGLLLSAFYAVCCFGVFSFSASVMRAALTLPELFCVPGLLLGYAFAPASA